jgi:hemolysin activation/secretion protein
MRSKMGLPWCENSIEGTLVKHLVRKFTPYGVGIIFVSGTGAMLILTPYVDATPCCTNANVAASNPISEVSKTPTDPVENFKRLKEAGCLDQYSTLRARRIFRQRESLQPNRIAGLSLQSAYSPLAVNNYAKGESLVSDNTDSMLRPNQAAWAIASGVIPTQNETLPALETNALSCLTELVALQPPAAKGELPHPDSVTKVSSALLGTEGKVSRNSLLMVENISPSPSLQTQNPTVSSAILLLPHKSNTSSSLQAQNQTPNPNQDRFLQPRPTPTPLAPDSTQPDRPSNTPTLEIPAENIPPQPTPTPTPTPSPTETPPQPTPTPTPTPTPSPQAIQVQKIKVTGSSIFSADQLNPIVQPYEGRTLTVDQLREVADKITQLYLDRGYITSRAILANQVIPPDGVVEIAVIEGSLEQIQVEGTRRVKPSYVRSRVGLGAGKPLNTGKLEDQLRLLRADPLFENVEASLRAGTRVGQSILIVRVVEANPFEGSVGVDNYSPPSVGSERLGLNLLYRNLTGRGDAVAASYYHTTTGGADIFDFSYLLPLNPMNGTLQLRAAPNRNKITQPPLNRLDIRGESDLYEISFRQPLIRSPREEFALSLGFTYQQGQTFTFQGPTPFGFGPDEKTGISATRVIKFGQDYLRRDVRGAWSLRSLFSIGIGALGATINPDPIPDGRFVSWLGQVQRVQILNEDNFLIVGADVQLTPNSLLPSQQFVIGGGQSLRGYRQNVRSGDNGVRFSIEDRITLQRNEAGAPIFQLAPFFDAGYVWNKSDNPNSAFLPSQRFLAGLGMGLIWEPVPKLSLRLDYGYPLIDIADRGTNAQDEGFYFSVRYQF